MCCGLPDRETHRSITVFDMAAKLKCNLYSGVLVIGGGGWGLNLLLAIFFSVIKSCFKHCL